MQVHLLNDERGPVIETLIARAQRQVCFMYSTTCYCSARNIGDQNGCQPGLGARAASLYWPGTMVCIVCTWLHRHNTVAQHTMLRALLLSFAMSALMALHCCLYAWLNKHTADTSQSHCLQTALGSIACDAALPCQADAIASRASAVVSISI